MISFWLNGPFPSKKNAWRRKPGQKAYLPGQIQADIDALIYQAIGERNKIAKFLPELAGRRLHVQMHFTVKKETKDLDNVFTTLLDVLERAGFIENDRKVRGFEVLEELDADSRGDRVLIALRPLL